MKITIYRGTKEIGGTLIEVATDNTRILFDAGYPLFLNNKPIEKSVKDLQISVLIELGVLPKIDGLYNWDNASFDAVIISHAHIDHYGLLQYINRQIPIYLSKGSEKLIKVSQLFKIINSFPINTRSFAMYKVFGVGDIQIKPFMMDHSAFDAAAFEITDGNKTVIYTGDFRGHGRKTVCLDRFISKVKKQVDMLLIEGTTFGRQEEKVVTEDDLEIAAVDIIRKTNCVVLFQPSSQNIDRLVSFYKAAIRCNRIFVVDVYTANVLYELKQLGNKLPYPSEEYENIKVFFPYGLTQKIFNDIGQEYAKRFSKFHISRKQMNLKQNKVVMLVRPSLKNDILKCDFHGGVFVYSLWGGYRDSDYQQSFEAILSNARFELTSLHTSGHASISDIKKVVNFLDAKKVVPIHTLEPATVYTVSEKAVELNDGIEYNV